MLGQKPKIEKNVQLRVVLRIEQTLHYVDNMECAVVTAQWYFGWMFFFIVCGIVLLFSSSFVLHLKWIYLPSQIIL